MSDPIIAFGLFVLRVLRRPLIRPFGARGVEPLVSTRPSDPRERGEGEAEPFDPMEDLRQALMERIAADEREGRHG